MGMYGQIGKETVNSFSKKVKIFTERMRGIDFSTVVQPEEIGFDSERVNHSSPSGNKYLTKLLDDLNVTEKDSILDIGSGKGSAMKSMLKYPFSKVDGVELSNYLAVIATRNFRKLNLERNHIFNCDATSFKNYSDYNIFYFYNPFPDEIMHKVLKNITQSAKDSGENIRLIYNNPVCHDVIISQQFFTKIKEYPDEWGNKIYIYSNNP